MALIKTIAKPEQNARLTVMVRESQLRKLQAYRLFLEQESADSYCPTLAQTVESFLGHIFSEDKTFMKWYDEKNKEQVASINALMKRDDAKPAQKDDDAA